MQIQESKLSDELIKDITLSTSSTPSVSNSIKTDVRAEAAASQDARWPTHSWYVSAAPSSSNDMVRSMLLEITLRATSTMPIGLIPGFCPNE